MTRLDSKWIDRTYRFDDKMEMSKLIKRKASKMTKFEYMISAIMKVVIMVDELMCP